jgi:hypothetical protein
MVVENSNLKIIITSSFSIFKNNISYRNYRKGNKRHIWAIWHHVSLMEGLPVRGAVVLAERGTTFLYIVAFTITILLVFLLPSALRHWHIACNSTLRWYVCNAQPFKQFYSFLFSGPSLSCQSLHWSCCTPNSCHLPSASRHNNIKRVEVIKLLIAECVIFPLFISFS